MSICQACPVLAFIKVHSREHFFHAYTCFQKGTLHDWNLCTALGMMETALWETPVLSASSCASLNLVFSSLLHCKASVCNMLESLSTSWEESANSRKVSLCGLKSGNCSINSCCRFSIAETYSSPLNAVASSAKDLHAAVLQTVEFSTVSVLWKGFHALKSCCDQDSAASSSGSEQSLKTLARIAVLFVAACVYSLNVAWDYAPSECQVSPYI